MKFPTNTKSAQNTQPKKKKAPTMLKAPELTVTRVFDGQYGIIFNCVVNGITVYGCRLCRDKNGEAFVGWPQTKDKNGQHWNIVFVPLAQEDQDRLIRAVVDMLQDKLQEVDTK